MHVWLNAGPYPCRIGFCTSEASFTQLREEASLTLPKSPEYPCNNGAVAYWWSTDTGVKTYIITIDEEGFLEDSLASLASVIAHEVYHVTLWIWKDMGQKTCNNEAESYYLQWLVKQILDLMGMDERIAA